MKREKRVLLSTIKKQWYEMIRSGDKLEEYKEIKPSWYNKLVFQPAKVFKYCTGYDYKDGLFLYEGVKHCCLNKADMIGFNQFDTIHLFNGLAFSQKYPNFEIEVKGIRIDYGKPEWGAEPGVKYFVISLGEIIK